MGVSGENGWLGKLVSFLWALWPPTPGTGWWGVRGVVLRLEWISARGGSWDSWGPCARLGICSPGWRFYHETGCQSGCLLSVVYTVDFLNFMFRVWHLYHLDFLLLVLTHYSNPQKSFLALTLLFSFLPIPSNLVCSGVQRTTNAPEFGKRCGKCYQVGNDLLMSLRYVFNPIKKPRVSP